LWFALRLILYLQFNVIHAFWAAQGVAGSLPQGTFGPPYAAELLQSQTAPVARTIPALQSADTFAANLQTQDSYLAFSVSAYHVRAYQSTPTVIDGLKWNLFANGRTDQTINFIR
jgi:hypothetical protein